MSDSQQEWYEHFVGYTDDAPQMWKVFTNMHWICEQDGQPVDITVNDVGPFPDVVAATACAEEATRLNVECIEPEMIAKHSVRRYLALAGCKVDE